MKNTIVINWTQLLLLLSSRISILLLGLFLSANALAQTSSIPTFVYHRFGDDRYPSTNTTLQQFEDHLKFLKAEGYEVVTLSEAINRMEERKSFPKTAVITIDDGYKSFYKNGLRLLRKYDFSATLFVNTETVGGGDFMDWDQLRRAQAAGIEIGNHSHSHAYFVNSNIAEFKSDLDLSESIFIKELKEKPRVYAYPYGEWNQQIASYLEEKGYAAAVAQNSGVLYEGAPRFHLPRFPMSEAYAEMEGFKSKIKTEPLRVSEAVMSSKGAFGSKEDPRLTLSFQAGNLKLSEVQCFIQGADCNKSLEVIRDGLVKLNARPDRPLKKRRTLFTITVPDLNGQWHWFSYLWVIPKIKE